MTDHQFRAEEMPQDDDGKVTPKATIVSMTHKPLQEMAAAAQMYRGIPVGDPSDISRHIALQWFEDMGRTRLTTPLEFIDIHFLLEGVTRAFTHQLVRQRLAVYVQESMRFAIKDNSRGEVAEPPSVRGLNENYPLYVMWQQAVRDSAENYDMLINGGMPAQDARGILPTNITTRIHYKTNLRALTYHAGNRLSAQAQQEWKLVWGEMIRAILAYGPPEDYWQQEAIASLFKPICFTTGKCEFMTADDRDCPIRERVEAHHDKGEHPSTWKDIAPDDWTRG